MGIKRQLQFYAFILAIVIAITVEMFVLQFHFLIAIGIPCLVYFLVFYPLYYYIEKKDFEIPYKELEDE